MNRNHDDGPALHYLRRTGSGSQTASPSVATEVLRHAVSSMPRRSDHPALEEIENSGSEGHSLSDGGYAARRFIESAQ